MPNFHHTTLFVISIRYYYSQKNKNSYYLFLKIYNQYTPKIQKYMFFFKYFNEVNFTIVKLNMECLSLKYTFYMTFKLNFSK